MMEWLKLHWLSAAVILFMLSMTLYGHYRGFLKTALSTSALIVSLILANTATPYFGDFLKRNTSIQQDIKNDIIKKVNLKNAADESLDSPEVNAEIALLGIPEDLKTALLKGNNEKIWQKLGADKLAEYVGQYLSSIIINIICCLLVFIVTWIVLHIILSFTEVFEKLPVVKGINHIAGAILGFCQSLIFIWLGSLVINIFIGTAWGNTAYNIISQSVFLSLLYKYNLLNYLLKGVILD